METMILRYPKVWVIDPSPHKKKCNSMWTEINPKMEGKSCIRV